MDFAVFVNIAFSFTLLESILGLGFCIVHILYSQCVFKVSCPGSTLGQVLFSLYTYYVINTDECSMEGVSAEYVYSSNTNSLTKPNIFMVYQAVYCALYIFWILSAFLIINAKRSKMLAIPWLIVTIFLSVFDVIVSGFVITDFYKDKLIQTCVMSYDMTVNGFDWASASMLAYTLRGGVVWIVNVVLFGLILYCLAAQNGKNPTPVNVMGKRNKRGQKDEYWANPGFQRDSADDTDVSVNADVVDEDDDDDDDILDNRREADDLFNAGPVYAKPTTGYGRGAAGAARSGNPPPSGGGYRPDQRSGWEDDAARDMPGYRAWPQQDGRGGGGGVARTNSVAEKIRTARENGDGRVADGGMWTYGASPGFESRPRETAPPPTKDVDSAFDFLSKYDTASNHNDHGMRTGSVHHDPKPDSRDNMSAKLRMEHPSSSGDIFNIPRVRVPSGRHFSRSPSQISNTGRAASSTLPGSDDRYYVPLKY